jgi:hypothetical protein
MNILFDQLNERQRRGSKPRCHLLTNGPPEAIAATLTSLAAPFGTVAANDRWMPDGFADLEEAQLHHAPRLLPPSVSRALGEWWLPANRQDARSPNFDVASTCTVEGVSGLLLIEAKAHESELVREVAGRRLAEDASAERRASHETIGPAIDSARVGLATTTGLSWQISRDTHYQMSNRFAWAWKLTQLGMPVVLIYLGFIRANDMSKPGEVPFADATAWETATMAHSKPLFPAEVWGRPWSVNGVPLIPLIRSLEVPCDGSIL